MIHRLYWGRASQMTVMTDPAIVTSLPTPNVKSIKKKRTANNCGTTPNLASASGYEMNANPGPPWTTSAISLFDSWARLPKMAKIVTPDSRLVNVSIKLTIAASLFQFIYLLTPSFSLFTVSLNRCTCKYCAWRGWNWRAWWSVRIQSP